MKYRYQRSDTRTPGTIKGISVKGLKVVCWKFFSKMTFHVFS